MDNNKKQQNYPRPLNSKASQSADLKRKTDLQTAKYPLPRPNRRRDQHPPGLRNDQQRSSKPVSFKQRPNVDKRPRARGGGFVPGNSFVGHPDTSTGDASNDVPIAGTGLVDVDETYDEIVGENALFEDHALHAFSTSSKRKNLNHLLNFQYARPEKTAYGGAGIHGVFGSINNNVGKKYQQQHKYNKEQFLQANFQFVIKSSAKPHMVTSPDAIVDWALIEQINIQTTEEPRCPICLYPPVAAKLTRCGHAYCWPCILHYLALNDKSWRKCPICYEAIHLGDLKSTAILQQSTFNKGDEISFQLMRRKKGSFFAEKFVSTDVNTIERYPQYSGTSDLKPFSKFLLAKRSDILSIIERERNELLADEDTTCPEYVFVLQALNLLNERREQLGDFSLHNKDEEEHFQDAEGVDVSPMDAVIVALDKIKVESNAVASIQQDIETTAVKEALLECIDGAGFVGDYQQADEIFKIEDSCDGSVSDDPTVLPVETINGVHQKSYFFYQSVDGQNIFLHPLNVKMLQACYGTLERAPLTLNARILQKECHTMDEDLRRRFTCLGHLPLTCEFAVVEVDLRAPIVSVQTLKSFRDDIMQRRMERERRDREEKKREKKIAAINDRQMGKLIATAAHLNLTSAQEFPVCGFDLGLMPVLGASPNVPSVDSSKRELITAEVPEVRASMPGTPPGPSYSSVIMSQNTVTASNAGLFPELSFGSKENQRRNAGKKNNNSGSAPPPIRKATGVVASNEITGADCEPFKGMGTTFGDVMEYAIALKKTSNSAGCTTVDATMSTNNSTTGNGKKKRDKKKMVVLFPFGGGGMPNMN